MKRKKNADNFVLKHLKRMKRQLYTSYFAPLVISVLSESAISVFKFANSSLIANIALVGGVTAISLSCALSAKKTFKQIDSHITKKDLARDKALRNKFKGITLATFFGAILPLACKIGKDFLPNAFLTNLIFRIGAQSGAIVTSVLLFAGNAAGINKELEQFTEEYAQPTKEFIEKAKDKTTNKKEKKKVTHILKLDKTTKDTEICRRFLVLPEDAQNIAKASTSHHISEQFFFEFADEENRTERSFMHFDDKYTMLTRKTASDSEADGMSRTIFEQEITEQDYKTFLEIKKGVVYKKDRYISGNYILDIFDSPFNDLCIAKVVFESDEARANFAPPDTFKQEITNDSRFTDKDYDPQTISEAVNKLKTQETNNRSLRRF